MKPQILLLLPIQLMNKKRKKNETKCMTKNIRKNQMENISSMGTNCYMNFSKEETPE